MFILKIRFDNVELNLHRRIMYSLSFTKLDVRAKLTKFKSPCLTVNVESSNKNFGAHETKIICELGDTEI